MNGRDLRLKSDYDSLQVLVDQSLGALVIDTAAGRPPDDYIITYRCRSIESLNNGKPVYSDVHRMRIRLPARYPLPSAPPRLDMLTPLYNPHIYPNLQVCLGNWQTTEYLDELVARVGALIQLDRRILNLRDPANPDAMEWVRKNLLLVPTDNKIYGPQATGMQPLEGTLPTERDPIEQLPDMLQFSVMEEYEEMEWEDT